MHLLKHTRIKLISIIKTKYFSLNLILVNIIFLFNLYNFNYKKILLQILISII